VVFLYIKNNVILVSAWNILNSIQYKCLQYFFLYYWNEKLKISSHSRISQVISSIKSNYIFIIFYYIFNGVIFDLLL